jgi:hypothetical protein
VWAALLLLLQRQQRSYDSALLEQLHHLFVAGFSHVRKSVRNRAVELWSTTFGGATSLVYPSALKPCVRALLVEIDFPLPGWPEPLPQRRHVVEEGSMVTESEGASQCASNEVTLPLTAPPCLLGGGYSMGLSFHPSVTPGGAKG